MATTTISAAASTTDEFHKADPDTLEEGDVMCCREYYTVQKVDDKYVHLCTMVGGHSSKVGRGLIKNEYFALKTTTTEVVSATRLVTVLSNTHGLPVRVGFYKKQTQARKGEMLDTINPDDLPSTVVGVTPAREQKKQRTAKRRRLMKYVDKASLGVLRIMTGIVVSVPTNGSLGTGSGSGAGAGAGAAATGAASVAGGGRFTLEDFFVDSDTHEGRRRLVDSRTLQWVDIGHMRYKNKEYKGECDGTDIPRFHGEVDDRSMD